MCTHWTTSLGISIHGNENSILRLQLFVSTLTSMLPWPLNTHTFSHAHPPTDASSVAHFSSGIDRSASGAKRSRYRRRATKRSEVKRSTAQRSDETKLSSASSIPRRHGRRRESPRQRRRSVSQRRCGGKWERKWRLLAAGPVRDGRGDAGQFYRRFWRV